MDSIDALESSLRKARFSTPSSAREELMKNPLLSEWALAVLVDRKVLKIRPDATVVGCPYSERPSRSAPPRAPGEWHDNWPKRGSVIDILDAERGEGIGLRAIQETLRECEEPAGHWVTLHSLWRLIKDGVVEKVGKNYRLTDTAKAEIDSRDPEAEVISALKAIGEPYRVEDYVAALAGINPSHPHLEIADIDQAFVDEVARVRKERKML